MRLDWDGNGTYRAAIMAESPLPLFLLAQQVRREKTGLHGRLSILANTTVLAWSNFNLERDEDRVRLSNSAHGHFATDVAKVIGKAMLKHEVDTFCRELDGALLRSVTVEWVRGSSERSAPPFVLNPYLIEGAGTLIFAPPGRGKSYLLLLMAVSIDAGISTLFAVPKARRVLLANIERSRDSMLRRLGAVNRILGLDPERPLLMMNERGKSLADIAETMRDRGKEEGAEVTLLDSISRSGMGDLNENRDVNRITDSLNGLAKTWAAIGHTARADESHIYGSVHFDAAADVMVQVATQKGRSSGTLGLGLEVTKANDIAIPEMLTLALEFDAGGLVLARKAKKGEFSEVEEARRVSLPDGIAEYLAKHGASAADDIAEGSGRERSTVARTLANDRRFVPVRREGKKLLYGLSAPPSEDLAQGR